MASRLFPYLEAFFVDRRERALARHEEDGPPPPNFNEAGRRLWWRGRTLQSVMAYDTAADSNPRLRYPQVQPTRTQPSRFNYGDPDDDSDDDGGEYDDYSGEYYRCRQEHD